MILGEFKSHQAFECFMKDCRLGCGMKISENNLKTHEEEVCPFQIIKCERCNEKGKRVLILKHKVECEAVIEMEKISYPLYSRCFAAYIAVGEYQEKNMNLKSPLNDLREIKIRLENHGFISDENFVRMNENSTKKLIEELLNNLEESLLSPSDEEKKNINADSLLLIYFTGHGENKENKFYLCPYDFDAKNTSETGIDLNNLANRVHKFNCKHVLFVLDCCFGGGIFRFFFYFKTFFLFIYFFSFFTLIQGK